MIHMTKPMHSLERTLEQKINDILPQTQCTQCGFEGCAPYAHAIAFDAQPINQCPPGGAKGIAQLAQLTNQAIIPLNPDNGVERPLRVAFIIEDACIGCTKCIQVCPTDAIVGAAKFMHNVLADRCTGCDLCVPACPVDCIEMPAAADSEWTAERARQARTQYEFRTMRLQREKTERQARHQAKLHDKHQSFTAEHPPEQYENAEIERKRASIEAALARARARRTSTPT
jgi:electron transport complex protein RnfB